MQLLTVAALGAVLLGLLVYRFVQALRELNDPKHPPGPLQIPFLGRIHDLPIQHMWLKFKAWSDQYGPQGFYRTTMLGANFIVVTDEKVAEDLLMRRAKINSDRPAIRSLLDSKSTAGSMAYLPLMGRNQHWARQRRFGHAFLTEAANAQYHGLLYHEAKRWVARLMAEPDDFQSSLEDMTSKVMCQLAWDDPSLSADLTRSAWGLLTQMSPAGPITNVLTPLWHLPLPLNPWKRAEMRRHAEQQAWWAARLDAARAKTARGALRACWTWTYLDREAAAAAGGPAKTTGLVGGDGEAASAIGMLALVGIFTVVGPLSYWLVAMVHHPRWQAAVQREVDEVCEGRMPVLGDTPRLPVLRACIKETMRWRPNVPTGVAHETEADDEYNGFFIPKGSRILPLDWAFLRNPAKYPDPDAFRPERWLEPGWPTYQAPLTQYPTLRGMSSFGWGQRQCLGMALTQDELVVACGALAWAFTLRHKVDAATGAPVPVPTDRCNSLLIVKPDPFEMAFEPRSEARKREALRLWGEAEAEDASARARARTPFLAENQACEVVSTGQVDVSLPVSELGRTRVLRALA